MRVPLKDTLTVALSSPVINDRSPKDTLLASPQNTMRVQNPYNSSAIEPYGNTLKRNRYHSLVASNASTLQEPDSTPKGTLTEALKP